MTMNVFEKQHEGVENISSNVLQLAREVMMDTYPKWAGIRFNITVSWYVNVHFYTWFEGLLDSEFQYDDLGNQTKIHLDGAYQYMRDINNSKRRLWKGQKV